MRPCVKRIVEAFDCIGDVNELGLAVAKLWERRRRWSESDARIHGVALAGYAALVVDRFLRRMLRRAVAGRRIPLHRWYPLVELAYSLEYVVEVAEVSGAYHLALHGRRLLRCLRRLQLSLDTLCDEEEAGDPAEMLGAFLEPLERELLETWITESIGRFLEWASIV